MVYWKMTDQARDFIAKYMEDGRMCSPYSVEWMTEHADRPGFETERVELLMKQLPELEGHLLVLDVSQAEVDRLTAQIKADRAELSGFMTATASGR